MHGDYVCASVKGLLLKDCRSGDMRISICNSLRILWKSIDQTRIAFLYRLIPSLLRLVQVKSSGKYEHSSAQIENEEIKDTSIVLYVELIQKEFQGHQAITTVETQTINSLDAIVNEGHPDADSKGILNFVDLFLTRYALNEGRSQSV